MNFVGMTTSHNLRRPLQSPRASQQCSPPSPNPLGPSDKAPGDILESIEFPDRQTFEPAFTHSHPDSASNLEIESHTDSHPHRVRCLPPSSPQSPWPLWTQNMVQAITNGLTLRPRPTVSKGNHICSVPCHLIKTTGNKARLELNVLKVDSNPLTTIRKVHLVWNSRPIGLSLRQRPALQNPSSESPKHKRTLGQKDKKGAHSLLR
jgi:hypothetical protein